MSGIKASSQLYAAKQYRVTMIKICTLTILAVANIHGLNIQPKIVKGTLSNPADFPFFVYISNDITKCSATLLSDRFWLFRIHFVHLWLFFRNYLLKWLIFTIFLSQRWIITAGHCLIYNLTLSVNFGIDRNGDFLQEMEVPVANQHIHPEYIDHNFPLQDLGTLDYIANLLFLE